MMNVKKYRATTTREALEKIKEDLGEDAFVLGTKQIRTGGFLGLRSSMQIEVSAAAPSLSTKPAVRKRVKTALSKNQIINLTENTLAMPEFSNQENQENSNKKEAIMSALSARVASSNNFESEVTNAPEVLPNLSGLERHKIEFVEISSEAPRFVHSKKEISKHILPEQDIATAKTAENSSSTTSRRDLELLRAEVREIKFSLNAFTNQQNTHFRQTDVDWEVFGEVPDLLFYDVYVELVGTGISPELARKFVSDIIPHYKTNPINADQLSQTTLLRAISSQIKFAPDVLQMENPATLAIIGATGIGKTTTIAKLAARVALYEQRRVELVTLDTYRIAAVEQLKTYAEIIGTGCHVVRSVFELDAVLRRLPSDATVLIDTTGRSPHDLADQYELSDYLQQHTEIRKCLVIQATTHPTDASAAIKKFEMYGADCLAITKMDETMRPGAIIETIAESNLPLAYFCAGQRVPEDLQVATAEIFTNRIMGKQI